MVAGLIWSGRKHFTRIIRNAWKPGSAGTDSDEIMSHRVIVVGTALSVAYLFGWLTCSGMTPVVALLFILSMLILYIGITRIVVESGLVFVRGPIVSQTFTAFTLGPASIPPRAMVAMGLSYSWLHELKGFFMPAACHASRLADSMRTKRRSVTFCVLLAAATATFVSIWFTLYMGYRIGALHFGGWIFGHGAQVPYYEVARKMTAGTSTDWGRLSFMGIGAAAMGVLLLLHYRFAWWPIHPMGLPVAVCSYPMNWYVFSIFLAWLAKYFTLWLGGNSLYRKVRPFFIGAILGFFVGVGISFFVDMVWFPDTGHMLYGD